MNDPTTPTALQKRGVARLALAAIFGLAIAGALIFFVQRDEQPAATSEARVTAPTPGGDWKTDTSRSAVPLEEFLSGGVPRDGIPSIDDPQFVPAAQATFVDPREPVLVYANRAYPLQILTWHEIVNDTVDGVPVAVTFCPLCNTAIVFDRRVDDATLEFGVSGMLRHSDLVMYDRTTESWWQQFDGRALVGELTGKQLKLLPSALLSFEDFAQKNPRGLVLSRDTGYDRDYGRNPYAGYDRLESAAAFGEGSPTDDRLPPKARVVMIPPASDDDPTIVYSLEDLNKLKVIHDDERVVLWTPGTASALDAAQINQGRDVGSAVVFDRNLDGKQLTFDDTGNGLFTDAETSSTWNIHGTAVRGTLKGQKLTPVEHVNVFWFAVAAFAPDATIYDPRDNEG